MTKKFDSTKLTDTLYLYVDPANPSRNRRFNPDCNNFSGEQLALEYVYGMLNKKRDVTVENIKKERLDFFNGRSRLFYRDRKYLNCAEGQIQHLVEEDMQDETEFRKGCIISLGDYLNAVFPVHERSFP